MLASLCSPLPTEKGCLEGNVKAISYHMLMGKERAEILVLTLSEDP